MTYTVIRFFETLFMNLKKWNNVFSKMKNEIFFQFFALKLVFDKKKLTILDTPSGSNYILLWLSQLKTQSNWATEVTQYDS